MTRRASNFRSRPQRFYRDFISHSALSSLPPAAFSNVLFISLISHKVRFFQDSIKDVRIWTSEPLTASLLRSLAAVFSLHSTHIVSSYYAQCIKGESASSPTRIHPGIDCRPTVCWIVSVHRIHLCWTVSALRTSPRWDIPARRTVFSRSDSTS